MIRNLFEEHEREQNENWTHADDIFTAIYYDEEKLRKMHFYFRSSGNPRKRAMKILEEKKTNYSKLKIKEDYVNE